MKKLLFLAAILFAATSAMAGNVDLSTAQTKAANFLKSKAPQGRLMTSTPTVKWVHEVKNSSNAAMAAYYIVNTDKGYVIVAGDDRSREILAYGNGTLTDLNDLPDAMQLYLNKFQKQIEYLQAHPGLKVQKAVNRGGVSVEPLLKTAWSQGKPYNMYCPKVGRDYCKVGCSALSLAQVMRYWEYPAGSPALPGYTGEEFGITVPALPEYTFDWDNMWDTYEDYTSESAIDRIPEVNKNAITYFLRYVGQAETMDYGTNMSGAEYPEIMQAIRTFGYDEGVHIEMKWDYDDGTVNYTEEEWGELIQSELIAGRPLVYCAFDTSGEGENMTLLGHAFNVDGYDAENDMYHVNFGMASTLNAYYALDAFQIDYVTVYDFFPLLFAGLQPPGLSTDPRILVDKQNVNMACYAGETATDTITVKGQYLTEGIAVDLNDENGVFSIDVNSIALDQVGNAKIIVTYAPQAVGTHNATITLTSEGANDKVVTLKGTATNAPLVVYDPKMLPADSTYITKTSFRADWTDQTVPENVVSYTLEVNQKPTSGLIAQADWSEVPSSGSAASYMPEGWTYNGSVYLEGGYISVSSGYSIFTPELDLTGFDKVTVVVRAKNEYSWTNSAISVKTSVDSKYAEFTSDFADYTFVLNCGGSEKIEIYSELYYPNIQIVKVYAGEVTAPQLRATEDGNETKRVITGITDKFYTVNNLLAEGTFLYKVKALYTDGTESAWSNTQMVTLFDNGPAPHEFEVGDVNHDHSVNIADVTALIDYLLGSGSVCTTCANVNGDDGINIADVTALIDKLLNSGN
jgi:hypothetical protein